MAKKKKGSKKKSGKKSKDNPGIESAKEEIALDDAFGIDEPKEEKKEVAAPDEDAMNPIALYNKLSNVEDLLEKRDKEIAELKETIENANLTLAEARDLFGTLNSRVDTLVNNFDDTSAAATSALVEARQAFSDIRQTLGETRATLGRAETLLISANTGPVLTFGGILFASRQ